MDRILGIDLGTTNSLVGWLDSGFPVLVASAEGRRLTPSVAHYPESGGAVVGEAARRVRALAPEATVYSAKRFIGRRFSELGGADREVDYELAQDARGMAAARVRGRLIPPEEVAAEILRKLKADAEGDIGAAAGRAVITVPAYFHDGQRTATRRAGEMAGLAVERILNEPTAAALACGLGEGRTRGLVAVYDLGGGTFDLSVLEINVGVFEVRSTHGNTRLGGDDIDTALAGWLEERVRAERPGFEPGAAQRARLREEAERVKIALSGAEASVARLPFLGEGWSFECEVRRADLERLARPILERTRGHMVRALADAGVAPKELDDVILVGGQTRMPLVRRLAEEWLGRGVRSAPNPDEAVALGAVLQAGILEGRVRDAVLLDVTPLSLGIETFGGLMNAILPRNSTIPVKRGEVFTTAADGQRAMKIRVLQGEREMARDNWLLGEFEVAFDPAPRGVARVGVQFEIDADGILRVLARNLATGEEQRITVKSAVDVSDDAVEKMVAESAEHAFADMAERRWTEAALKAGELLGAARRALATLEERVGGERRRAVEALVAEVEAAKASGETARLKKAVEALDEGTQDLADQLMDMALERAGVVKGVGE